MRLLAAVFSLSIACAVGAQSPEPPQQPEQTSNPCTDPCRYQGTAAPGAPITVNVHPPQALDKSPGKEDTKEHAEGGWEKWVAIWTGALAAATFALGAVALWQRFDLADVSKRELRAYTYLEDFRFDKTLLIAMENYGKTPAHDVCLIYDRMPIAPKERPKYTPDSPNIRMGTFGPGQGYEHTTSLDEAALGNAPFWLHGKIAYVDAFGDKWVSHFCYEVTVQGGAMRRKAYAEYNDDGREK